MFQYSKHFETFLSFYILIDLDQVNKTIAEAIERQGGNKSEIARKLGISSQLLGQYALGRQKPKGDDFYYKWMSAFGEDLKTETFVSVDQGLDKHIATKNITVDSSVIWSMMREANEERIKELKEHNAFLQKVIESGLVDLRQTLDFNFDKLHEGQAVQETSNKAWVKVMARLHSGGSKEREAELLNEMDNIFAAETRPDANKNNEV